MPTVLRTGPYRIYFYSHEPNEPSHVHIDREDLSCKFWLRPVALARNLGFSAKELRDIEKIITENNQLLWEAWNGYFGN
jgi:hypothetical protein